jgi:hypothetical protein
MDGLKEPDVPLLIDDGFNCLDHVLASGVSTDHQRDPASHPDGMWVKSVGRSAKPLLCFRRQASPIGAMIS